MIYHSHFRFIEELQFNEEFYPIGLHNVTSDLPYLKGAKEGYLT